MTGDLVAAALPSPHPGPVDESMLKRLQRGQSGVVSRRQVLTCGGTDSDIERLVHRREWARLHLGVYVDHTGPPTWDQRAWAAVLLHWPAALAGASALRAHGLTGLPGRGRVEVGVARGRRVDDPAGVVTRQVGCFDRVALLDRSPPRVRVEYAALTVAARSHTADQAVAILGDACQQGRTTADPLLTALKSHPRLRRRRLLVDVLGDVASGANSALERRYLLHVERAHRLPRGHRQDRVVHDAGVTYRDVSYRDQCCVVELDGRIGHEGAADRWADLDRDVASALAGDLTVRLGWLQVLEPCRAAGQVGRLLMARGWAGRPTACCSGCVAV